MDAISVPYGRLAFLSRFLLAPHLFNPQDTKVAILRLTVISRKPHFEARSGACKPVGRGDKATS